MSDIKDILKKMAETEAPGAGKNTLKEELEKNFDEIESFKQRGYTDAQIIRCLKDGGKEINENTFRTTLSKIRIKRKSAQTQP